MTICSITGVNASKEHTSRPTDPYTFPTQVLPLEAVRKLPFQLPPRPDPILTDPGSSYTRGKTSEDVSNSACSLEGFDLMPWVSSSPSTEASNMK
jgi:hypothetical protein